MGEVRRAVQGGSPGVHPQAGRTRAGSDCDRGPRLHDVADEPEEPRDRGDLLHHRGWRAVPSQEHPQEAGSEEGGGVAGGAGGDVREYVSPGRLYVVMLSSTA